jgi:hypothetical protein
MQSERSLVERYRKRAEEIRTYASGLSTAEDRTTLLQLAAEYDLAAIEQEKRLQTNMSIH